jgi:hypothetical protein
MRWESGRLHAVALAIAVMVVLPAAYGQRGETPGAGHPRVKRVVWLAPPPPPASYVARFGAYPDRIRAHFVARGLVEGRDIKLTFEELSADLTENEIEERLDRVLASEPEVVAARWAIQ